METYLVARRGDNMVEFQLPLGPIVLQEFERDTIGPTNYLLHARSQMTRDTTHKSSLCEPSRSRAQVALDGPLAHAARHGMEEEWGIRTQP